MYKPGDIVFQVIEDGKNGKLYVREYIIISINLQVGSFIAEDYPEYKPLFLCLVSPTKVEAVRQYRKQVIANIEMSQYTIYHNVERLRKLEELSS